MPEVILIIIASILMLAGLAGVILPFLPGVPLIWLGFFIYALGTGFGSISLMLVLILLGVTVLVLALDFLAPLLGAKKYKASKLGVLGSFLGTIIGLVFLGFWGIIIGPFVGAFLGEVISGRTKNQAFKSAWGTFVGFFFGTLARLILSFIIIGFFIASFF